MSWRVQSLFSGIGGLDLGVEAALNAKAVALCELADAPRAILEKHWPDADITENVLSVAGVPGVDVVTAGFPCQDASVAFQNSRGGGKGLDGDRTGLWTEVIRVVQESSPKVVVLENVRGLLRLGFERVLSDLDAAGYDARWGVWSAAAVGAPHIRERLITVAVRRDWMDWIHEVDLTSEVRFNAADFSELPEQSSGAWDPDASEDPSWFAKQAKRLRMAGNAVCPLVAQEATRRCLAEWPKLLDVVDGKLPPWGAQVNGVLHEIEPMVERHSYGPPQKGDWVRWEDSSAPHNGYLRPCIGRVVYAEPGSCSADVELPGGSVEPFDLDQLKKWWPTPTAHDDKDTGSISQYRRKSPGLPSFTGGIGCPHLAEWAMGLPADWTAA